jgi:hypothetical protein
LSFITADNDHTGASVAERLVVLPPANLTVRQMSCFALSFDGGRGGSAAPVLHRTRRKKKERMTDAPLHNKDDPLPIVPDAVTPSPSVDVRWAKIYIER